MAVAFEVHPAMVSQISTASVDPLANRLDMLLGEDEGVAREREKMAFDLAAGGFVDRIVLFGAGRLGRKTMAGMRRLGQGPLAFADNNLSLSRSSIEGVPVYSAAEAARLFGRTAVFVVTIWNSRSSERMSERIQQLHTLGCERVVPAGLFFWKHPDIFLPYFSVDLPHKALPLSEDIRRAFHLFQDDKSRLEFVGEMAFRLHLDYDNLGWPENIDHYAPADLFDLSPEEVFVDCGAFDGDSIAAFVEQQGEVFSQIVAFEPDPLNVEKLQQRIAALPELIRHKIAIFPNAVGARHEIVHMDPTGLDTSRIGKGSFAVECMTLDDALQGVAPSLIKFDIEGAELDALEGAGRVISRCRPVLAVSAYHEQAHLWQVPLRLAEICDRYRFFLRPQGTEGWDLICYAIPVERLMEKRL